MPSVRRHPSFVRLLLAGAATALLALGAGCATPGVMDPARKGPFFEPTNYAGDVSLGGIRRVVVLPLWAASNVAPESVSALDGVFVSALQDQKRFEVVSIARADCRRRFGADSFSSATALPHDLLATLKREFAAEAVLFVDLTVYEPYKPLALGLRGKLAAIDGSRLMWTFDQVFSAENPLVANSARHYFLDRDRSIPADMTHAVLQSPSRFAAYAANAMFATLPPVNPPPPPPVTPPANANKGKWWRR